MWVSEGSSFFGRSNKDNHMKNKLTYVRGYFCCFLFVSKCKVHFHKFQLMKPYERVLVII